MTTPSSKSKLSVQLITTIEGIDAVQHEWAEFLRDRAGNHSHMQQPQVVRCNLIENQHRYEPLVAIVRADDRIELVAPWHIHRLSYDISFSVLTICRPRLRLCKLFGADMAIARDAAADAVLSAMFETLYAERKRYDVIALYDRPYPGLLLDYVDSAHRGRSPFKNVYVDSEPLKHNRLLLPDSFDAFWDGHSSKIRREFRRYERRLHDATSGTLSFEAVTDPAQVARFFGHADRVYRKSWQGSTMGGARGSAGQVRFCEEVAELGWLRCHLVSSEAGPISYSVGYAYNGVFYAHDMAYDLAWREYAPGNVMCLRIIRDLCESTDVRVMDYGSGDSLFKRRFSNSTGECRTVHIVPRGHWYGRSIVGTQRAFRVASEAIRSLVHRLGIDRWLREHLKRRARTATTRSNSSQTSSETAKREDKDGGDSTGRAA